MSLTFIHYCLAVLFVIYGWLLMPLYLVLKSHKNYKTAINDKSKNIDDYLAHASKNRRHYLTSVILFSGWFLYMGTLLTLRIVK